MEIEKWKDGNWKFSDHYNWEFLCELQGISPKDTLMIYPGTPHCKSDYRTRKTVRRKIEDALRKTCSDEQLLTIVKILNVRIG